MSREDFSSVCENLGSPPLELAVFSWGKGANEGFSWVMISDNSCECKYIRKSIPSSGV